MWEWIFDLLFLSLPPKAQIGCAAIAVAVVLLVVAIVYWA